MIETIGWLGAALLLVAYGLGSLRLIKPYRVYHFLNAIGALGLAFSSWELRAHPAAVLNICWFVIGVVLLCQRSSIADKANSENGGDRWRERAEALEGELARVECELQQLRLGG